jgi:amino acid adenylation domain-containing protein
MALPSMLSEAQELTPSPLTFTTVDFDPFAQGELSNSSPPTEPQREIWLSVQMSQDANCAFNESQTLRLRGSLDISVLRSALQALVQQHESLRISFSPDGESLCIAAAIELSIPMTDLSNLSGRDQKAAWENLRRTEVKQPFDLINGPLFRVQIVRLHVQEHLLVITGHHIICDGWSLGVMLPDLAALYSAQLHGKIADLELPGRFSQYAQLQQQLVQGSEFQQAEQYWLKQFATTIPVLDLPRDRPRPALKTYTADREDWPLPPTLVKDLKRVGAKSGCSFFTTLLVGFEVFLSRLSGQPDLVVGTPAAGQSFSGQEWLVGHCVNFLPLISHVDNESAFVAHLKLRRSQIMDAYEHQQMSFGSLIQKLNLPRDPSRTPLVSVVFNYDRALSGSDLPFQDLEVELFSNPRYFENFEIFINACEVNGSLVLECQYNTDLFDAATIRRRLEAFEVMLAGVVADPQQPIWKLPIVPPSEAELLRSWNQTQVTYAANQCIHHWVEAQVERTPNAIAVVCGDQKLTYRELNARANQVASYLQFMGVGPDVLVGICLHRSLDMVVALLGILKAGGAYVPLDSAHPIERIAYVLQDTAAPILLTQRSLVDLLPAHTAKVICLDEEQPVISREPKENLNTPIVSGHLAYVIYTSGSTGKPKGVQIEHRSAVNLLNAIKAQPGLTAQDKLLSVTTITFDISVAEIFLPLVVGAQLIVASRDVASDGAKLLSLLQSSGATFLQPTPVTWQLLLAAGWKGSPNLTMISTGEALPSELASQLHPKGASLWNLYGPTETTIWSSTYRVEPGKPILIGRPLDNTQFHVLDAHLQPVPIGIPGELYIGGDGLARGYLNRPDLTAEKFIPNPFFDCRSQNSSPQLYKTGDLVRYCLDGNVECLGRIDYQVKIRGFRIELGEIETLLSQHPAVQEAVVVAREDSPGNKRLVAYLVAAAGHTIEVKAVKDYLSQQLPDYMRPVGWVVMEKFPLTGSGKVDRKALPAPELEPINEKCVAPRTQLEMQLAQSWKTLLGVETIGVTDNFFDLGGHSLLAARLLAEIGKTFDTVLPLATLFQHPTIEQLAGVLTQSEPVISSPALAIIQPGDSKTPLFGIHVLGEGMEFYRPFVSHLDPAQPVYGLSTQIMAADQAPENQVEELAAYYVQEMRKLQPQGPYLLTGVSFGGVVAFEIAQRLQAQGQTVALLALLDTYNPVADIEPLLSRRQRISRLLKLAKKGDLGTVVNKAKLNVKKKLETLDESVQRVQCKLYRRLGRPLPDRLQNLVYRTENEQASHGYAPQVYPGHITLLQGKDSRHVGPEKGWENLAAGGLEVLPVPGSHLSMLRDPDNAQVLGQTLQRCIKKALKG